MAKSKKLRQLEPGSLWAVVPQGCASLPPCGDGRCYRDGIVIGARIDATLEAIRMGEGALSQWVREAESAIEEKCVDWYWSHIPAYVPEDLKDCWVQSVLECGVVDDPQQSETACYCEWDDEVDEDADLEIRLDRGKALLVMDKTRIVGHLSKPKWDQHSVDRIDSSDRADWETVENKVKNEIKERE